MVKKPRKDIHVWKDNRCERCGLHITKVYDLKFYCKPNNKIKLGYRRAPKKKTLSD